MRLLCDENIPLDIANNLSSKHKVVHVSKEYPGIKDEEVYMLAYKNRMCILTSDHHFDRYKNRKNYGIIRLSGNLKKTGELLKKVLQNYKESNDNYSVIKNSHSKVERKLRKRVFKFS